MAGTYSQSYVPTTGDTITVARWNSAWNDHYNGNDFTGLGDYSSNATEMQSTVDPYPSSTESLATDGKGELERLRYQLKTQLGLSQWYHDVTVAYETFVGNISSYRRPRLVYVSASTVDVENNTGTEHQTKIVFPDGSSRSVTENTGSTNVYRRFDITATATFASGTIDSGVRSGISEATDTWYAIYAVKCTKSGEEANFILAGDTTLPTQANFATLNSRYGTNGWVYLGLIRNGDGASATGNIIDFRQAGAITMFNNLVAGNGGDAHGIRFATSSGSTGINYSTTGGTGTTDIPGHLELGWFTGFVAGGGSGVTRFRDNTPTISYYVTDGSTEGAATAFAVLDSGFRVTNGSSIGMDILFSGWVDPLLGSGTNPIL